MLIQKLNLDKSLSTRRRYHSFFYHLSFGNLHRSILHYLIKRLYRASILIGSWKIPQKISRRTNSMHIQNCYLFLSRSEKFFKCTRSREGSRHRVFFLVFETKLDTVSLLDLLYNATPHVRMKIHKPISDQSHNTLGVDRWTKHIGLSYRNDRNQSIAPIGSLSNDESLFFNIWDVMARYRIGHVVVGYPKQHEDIQIKIDEFLSQVNFVDPDVTVERVDEEYSSVEAWATTWSFEKGPEEDTVASMKILEWRCKSNGKMSISEE